MKLGSFKIRQLTLIVTISIFGILFFIACNKEKIVEPELGSKALKKNDAEEIAVLAERHSDRFFVNKKFGLQSQYIVLLKETYIRPVVLSEKESITRPIENEVRNSDRRQQVVAAVQDFIAHSNISREKVSAIFEHLIAGFVAELTAEQVAALLKNDNVESIEQDITITVDDILESVDTPGNGPEAQVTPCGITRHGGASYGYGHPKFIWIVDSGIQSNHPDLNVVTNPTYARSFVGGSYQDCNGHGTHIAGTAAAKHNSIGVVGMSAGAWVVPIKVFDGCGIIGKRSNILSALNHVATYDVPGDVVNLSLGSFEGANCNVSSPYKTAIQNLGNSGTWVVIAAGNNSNYAGLYQPGCINSTRVLTIANMSCTNIWNSSSNFNLPAPGLNPIDWIAVGTSVYSTHIGSNYAYMTGTSMAAPHVAGIVHQRQGIPLKNGSVTKYGLVYNVASRN